MSTFLDKYEPETKSLIIAIKYVQKQIKAKKLTDEQLQDSDTYVDIYTGIAEDENVSWFADTYPDLYKLIIKGADYDLVARIIFYFDQFKKGMVNEKDLAEFLKKAYWKGD